MGKRIRFKLISVWFLLLLAAVLAGAAAFVPWVEHFDTTTYLDAANTTADWDTVSGVLRLPPYPLAQVGQAAVS